MRSSNPFSALESSPPCTPQASPMMRPVAPGYLASPNLGVFQSQTRFLQAPEVDPFPGSKVSSMRLVPTNSPVSSYGHTAIPTAYPVTTMVSSPVPSPVTSLGAQRLSPSGPFSAALAGALESAKLTDSAPVEARSRKGSGTASDFQLVDYMTPPASSGITIASGVTVSPSSPKWTTVAAPVKRQSKILDASEVEVAPPPLSLGRAVTDAPVGNAPTAQPLYRAATEPAAAAVARPRSDSDEFGGVNDLYYEAMDCKSMRGHSRAQKQTRSFKGQKAIGYSIEKRQQRSLQQQARNVVS